MRFQTQRDFFTAQRYASAEYVVVMCLPVRQSVRPLQVGVLLKWLYIHRVRKKVGPIMF